MKCTEALTLIESPEFDARLSMYSSAKAFFRAMAADSVVVNLHRPIHESGELREEVLDRIYDLSALEIDPRYENPNDKSLAALLWLTYYTSSEFAKLAAHYTASAPNCWYANKLARSILFPPRVESENGWINIGPKDWNISNTSATVSSFNMIDTGVKFRFLSSAVPGTVMSENHKFTVGELS